MLFFIFYDLAVISKQLSRDTLCTYIVPLKSIRLLVKDIR